jgi:hypothetical protein
MQPWFHVGGERQSERNKIIYGGERRGREEREEEKSLTSCDLPLNPLVAGFSLKPALLLTLPCFI